MKRSYAVVFFQLLFFALTAQEAKKDSAYFNYSYWNGVADKKQLSGAERKEFIASHKRRLTEPEITSTNNSEDFIASKSGYGNVVNAGPCTNIGFESGNFTGWTRSSGYHPGYNTNGCCPNANGQQTIVTGTGVDPYGGFPVVFPGGSFSVRLGNNGVNGQADRLEQTFFVTQANANFTYRYAVVLNDPGHIVAEQPYFEIMILDTLGAPVICTQYTVAAGVNNPGFFTSTLTANNAAVRYKPWTSVAMDLTPLIGQNVKLRFTTYDCALGGHFGYAYVDGLCTNFDTSVADTTCKGTAKQMCAPVGFLSYSWNGPGTVNNTSICINPVLPGTYTCQTVLVPGCPGPSFVHTLTTLPTPSISFTATSSSSCATQYSFSSVATITAGSISSYSWSFGDNTGSSQINPVHNYPGPGTYTVRLRVTAASGCRDSISKIVTISPYPVLNFSPPSNCINSLVQFTNSSTIASGSIASYSWTLGNGSVSTVTNPATTYTANGTYTITLSATSNMGCVSTLVQTLSIHPPPVLNFSAAPLCDINGTTFSPITSTAIASGSLVSYRWEFGDGASSNLQSPVHVYASPGTYTVAFTGTSNHACVQTVTNAFIISPTPSVAFSTASLNACSPQFTFSNNSAIAAGSISYSWNFGASASSTASSPSYTFPSTGTYTVRLVGTSNMGCADTSLQVITIHPYPVISFSVPSPCENAIFSCSASAVTGSVTSYAWNFGDPGSGPANTSTLQNPSHAYPSSGNYTVQLNIVSNNNCLSTYSTALFAYPNPLASFSRSLTGACDLSQSFINSSSVTAAGGNSLAAFSWNLGGINSSSLTSPTQVFPAPGIYTISLIAITNRNCMDTAYSVLTIHPKPALSFSALPACINSPVNFSSTATISQSPTPGASVVSHTWSFGNNATSNVAAPPAQSYTSSGIYTVSYAATSDQGCSSSVSETLSIYPAPVVSFSVSRFCFSDSTQFNANASVSSGSISSVSWLFGDNTASTQASAQHVYTLTGNYTASFSATTDKGCITGDTAKFTVYPLPTVSFSVTSVCAFAQTTFSSTSGIAAPSSLSSFTWHTGVPNQTLSGAQAVFTYSNAGTYQPTLTVMSDRGCISSATGSLLSYPLPTASFTAPATCMNSPLTFSNGTSIASGSISSWAWSFGNGQTATSLQPVYIYTASNTYTAGLVATSDQGCTGSFTAPVVIHPQAVPDFTLSNVCFNDVTLFSNLTNTLVAPGSSVSGYSWNFGDGGSSTAANPTHVYANSGNFAVTFTALTSMSCSSSITRSITIFPLPAVSFSAAAVCLNDSSSFVNSSSISPAPPNTISSYSWALGDGATSTLSSLKHRYLNHGVFTPTLYLVSNQGCSNSGAASVIVNPLPAPAFNAIAACVNSSIQFSNTSSIASGSIAGYSWDFGDGSTSGLVQPAHSYTTHNNYTVTLTATSVPGCQSYVTQTVAVHPYPQVTVTPVQNGCENKSVNIFSAFSIPSTAVSSYTWNFGDNSAPASVNASTVQPFTPHVYTAYNTYTIHLKVRSTENCITNTYTTITIYPTPVPSFSTHGVCFKDTTAFTNNSTIPTGSISAFSWHFSDGPASAGSYHARHLFSKDTVYKVVLTATSVPEPGLYCVASVTNNVNIHPLPYPSFTTNAVCAGSATQFSNTTPGQGISSWLWDFESDGQPNSTFITPQHIYPAAGSYTAMLAATNNFSCVNSFSQTVIVHPNPSVSFSTTPTCFGEPTFFASSTLAGNTYTWNIDGGVFFQNSVPDYTFAAPGVHTVQLTVKSNTSGCSSKVTNTLTVEELPVISFTAASVCKGIPSLISNNSYIAAGSIVKYRWDFESNGWDDSSSTTVIPPHVYKTAGSHAFKLWAMSALGCKSQKSGLVRVYEIPVADFKTGSICEKTATTFSNNSVSEDGQIARYQWDFNADRVYDAETAEPAYTFTTAGSHAAHLRVTSQFGCIDSVSKVLTIYPRPEPNYSADKTSGCPPLCVKFTDKSKISSGSYSLTWDFGDQGKLERIKDPQRCFEAGTYHLSLKLVSDRNCAAELKHPGYVVAHPLPVAAFAVEPEEIDEEEPLISVSNTAANAGTVKYYINDGSSFSKENFTHKLKLSGNQVNPMIVQVASNDFGCADTTYKVLNVRPAFSIYFPNVFSPNDDGLNDGFGAKGVGILHFAMQIYDRWGHLLFTSSDIRNYWDGHTDGSAEPVKQDVYTWKAQVTDIFHKKHDFIGRVTLLR